MDNLPDNMILEGTVVGNEVESRVSKTPLERLGELVREGLLQPVRIGTQVTLIATSDALPALEEMGIRTAGTAPRTKRVLGLAPDQQIVSLEDVGRNLGISTTKVGALLQENLPPESGRSR